MSDLAELRARALAAREFTQSAGGDCVITLRVPTRLEVRQMAHERGLLRDGPADTMALLVLQQHLLRRAVVGWTGVREQHLVPGGGTAPVPWSAEAAELWLDANPDAADALGAELLHRVQLRGEQIEADSKN